MYERSKFTSIFRFFHNLNFIKTIALVYDTMITLLIVIHKSKICIGTLWFMELYFYIHTVSCFIFKLCHFVSYRITSSHKLLLLILYIMLWWYFNYINIPYTIPWICLLWSVLFGNYIFMWKDILINHNIFVNFQWIKNM